MSANLTSAHPLYYPDLASFRPLVDDALRLADRALDRAGSHIDGNADVGLDAVLKAGHRRVVSFHQDGQMVEGPVPGNLERVMWAEPRLLERSEEHTSELQSQSNLVCRLLLEKKKKHKYNMNLRKCKKLDTTPA